MLWNCFDLFTASIQDCLLQIVAAVVAGGGGGGDCSAQCRVGINGWVTEEHLCGAVWGVGRQQER